MTNPAILAFVAAYVVLAALLLSLNAVSLWRWWVKIAAVVVTTAFFGATYVFTNELLGWPAPMEPPHQFSLLWSRIVEPNAVNGVDGSIYLWAQELDETKRAKGPPRAFSLTYSKPLAIIVGGAQEKRDKGIPVMGTIDRGGAGKLSEDQDAAKGKPSLNANRTGSPGETDTVAFSMDAGLHFEDLPAPELPDKGPGL
jgi:hypothetical protein